MWITRRLARGVPLALFTGMDSQRRIERVTLHQPVPAVVDGEHVYVVDASTRGIRLSHSSLFPQGAKCEVAFEWDGKPIEFVARQRWTKLQRNSSRSGYQSGFEIASIDDGSNVALRTLIESYVERALDEQKANAKGIPPLAPSSIQSGMATLFVRHELVQGVWRKMTTTESRQPQMGFTVSSTESIHQIDLLRAAYSAADPSMRDMIRKLAELSIEHSDGMPARRYKP
jgi:hypothetical protein